MTPNLRGALLMMGSMTLFTVNDAFLKSLSGALPLSQAVFLRGVATSLLMILLLRLYGVGLGGMSGRDRRLILIRNVTEIVTAACFLTALFNMPLANASAIMQALPLSVTLAGAVFLGQAVGWRRLTAILIGFAGVMLIVRPGMEGFTVYSLYVLAAVVFVTIRDVLSRLISPSVPSLLIGTSNAIAVTLAFGLASLFVDWAPVGLPELVALTGSTLSIIGAYVCAVATMRVGDIAVIAPFRYTSLVVAVILGLVVFSERPDALTLIGSAIVVGTGLYTLWREQKLARQPA